MENSSKVLTQNPDKNVQDFIAKFLGINRRAAGGANMVFDTHVHSKMSTDSQTEPENAIGFARKHGLGLAFTEHYDADYFKNDYDFRVDPNEYLRAYSAYRHTDALLGIEIGLTHMSIDLNKQMAQSHAFDFVIGSVHMVGKTDIYFDFNKKGYPTITGEAYYDYIIDMIEQNDFFDALGHIDYPHRYINNRPIDFSLKTHEKKFDIIFKSLADRNIPLELNSRRLYGKKEYIEMYEIYNRYHQRGGRYITIGSDSHYPEQIGQNFKNALLMAKDIGLIPVYFVERKRHVINL